MNERTLKIQPLYRTSKASRKTKIVPSIILQGEWLKNAGFSPGQSVNLTIQDGQVTICPAAIANEKTISDYNISKSTFEKKYNSLLGQIRLTNDQ